MVRTPKGYDARYPLRLPDELKTKCESAAADEKISLNDWMVKVLDNAASGKIEVLRRQILDLDSKLSSTKHELEAQTQEAATYRKLYEAKNNTQPSSTEIINSLIA